MEPYWHAFNWLSRYGREFAPMSGTPLPFSLAAIESYVARFGPHDADDFDDFLSIISALDDEARKTKE